LGLFFCELCKPYNFVPDFQDDKFTKQISEQGLLVPTVLDPVTRSRFRDGVSRSLFRAASDQLYGQIGWLDTVQQAVYTYMVSVTSKLF
jgi:hypothetical protein